MSRHVQRRWTSLLAVALFAGALAGCSPDAGEGAQTNNAGPRSDDLRATTMESAGVTVRQDVEQRLESIKGLRNVSVLMYNGDAYVGLTEIGTEKAQDMTVKAGDNWKGNPYGTQSHPKSAAGMTVQDMQRESINNGALHEGPYSTMSGNVDPRTYQKIVDAVKQISPNAQRVYVTGNIDQTQKLSGYKHFIMRGGNMRAHRDEFSRFLQTAFPQADRTNMNTTNLSPSSETMRDKINNGTMTNGLTNNGVPTGNVDGRTLPPGSYGAQGAQHAGSPTDDGFGTQGDTQMGTQTGTPTDDGYGVYGTRSGATDGAAGGFNAGGNPNGNIGGNMSGNLGGKTSSQMNQ